MISYPKSSAAFFEAKYQGVEDPWDFEQNAYERNRYDSILRSIEDKRWKSVLEPGCSIGVLTEGLAPLCDRLLALDFSATALRAAERRCSKFSHVRVECLAIQNVVSFANFDLIVLSEIGYYFTERAWSTLIDRMIGEMAPQAALLAAHWTGFSEDHVMSGDCVHEILINHPGLAVKQSERHPGFRLERLELL